MKVSPFLVYIKSSLLSCFFCSFCINNNIMTTNIGIGFITGKRHFTNVLTTYVNNWLEHGLLTDKKVNINVLIAGDFSAEPVSLADIPNANGGQDKKIISVTLINKEYIDREIGKLTSSLKLKENEIKLVFGEGPARKRNLILYVAMKIKLDSLIFLNDNEYPLASFRNEKGQVSWMGQSIAGTHQKYISKTDISVGQQCGYISPIPFISFDDKLTENDFRLFIESIGDELIQWNNLKRDIVINKGVAYPDEAVIQNETVIEVKERRRMKLINNTSLCLNLKKQKKFPPFFNPPGVSAEFSFLSTCLNDYKILKMPCYTFHDGFGMYKSILNGVLPVRFLPADKSADEVVNKFLRAAIAWTRSKPLLVFIMQTGNYGKIMESIKSNLNLTIPKICNYFGRAEFEQLHAELDYYDRNVRKHYNLFSETKRVWSLITTSLS